MKTKGAMRILAVGRLKEAFFAGAQAEYVKRLTRYGGVTVDEVPDESAPERLSEKQRLEVIAVEGERLLQRISPEDWVVTLDILGRRMDSVAFASLLQSWRDAGKRPVFVIGGSLGLSPSVSARANETLSISDMTLCHPLARVVLLEQLYRASRINAGQPYHK